MLDVDVDGVPGDLLALIGAPMPEVDLTIESEEDVERWLSEVFIWNAWLGANPTTSESVLGLVLEGSYLDSYVEGKQRILDAGLLTVGGQLEVKSVEINMENFDIGIISLVVESRRAVPLWTLRSGTLEVTHVLESDSPETSVFSTVVVQAHTDGDWRLVTWQRR